MLTDFKPHPCTSWPSLPRPLCPHGHALCALTATHTPLVPTATPPPEFLGVFHSSAPHPRPRVTLLPACLCPHQLSPSDSPTSVVPLRAPPPPGPSGPLHPNSVLCLVWPRPQGPQIPRCSLSSSRPPQTPPWLLSQAPPSPNPPVFLISCLSVQDCSTPGSLGRSPGVAISRGQTPTWRPPRPA